MKLPEDKFELAHWLNSNTRQNNMLGTIEMEFLEASKDKVMAKMPVGPKILQPDGIVHGGANVTLAEALASVGGWLNVDHETQTVVGLEINANHIRAIRDGTVTGTAVPIHMGRSTQIWEIKLVDDQNRLTCVSRCTLAVISNRR